MIYEMLIITGSYGSGKTKTCEMFSKWITQRSFYDYDHNKNVDRYREILFHMASIDGVADMNISEAFVSHILELPFTYVLITCDREIQYKRLAYREQMEYNEVKLLYKPILNTMNKTQEFLRPDYIIDNSGSLDQLQEEVERIYYEING